MRERGTREKKERAGQRAANLDEQDIGAGFCKRHGHGLADAFGGAGDERGLAIEPEELWERRGHDGWWVLFKVLVVGLLSVGGGHEFYCAAASAAIVICIMDMS